jgi:hypothetical protein
MGRDGRLAGRLDDLAVLELHPAGATLQQQDSGCADSTGAVYAERIYHPASTIDEVMDFYRRTVPADGWKLEFVKSSRAEPGQPRIYGPRLCFSRTIEGTTTFLAVWFQSDYDKDAADALGRDPRDFGLVVRATPDDSILC